MNQPIVDFVPTGDPLLRHPELAYVVELPILGLATRFESNSRLVLDVVESHSAHGGRRRRKGRPAINRFASRW